MDHAVALVQTYLQLNGYFTTAEYPIIEAMQRGGYRAVTDIDLLGFRLPASALRSGGKKSSAIFQVPEPDAMLRIPQNSVDLLIGEVKEGKTHMNEPTTDRNVLRSVVHRFGFQGDVERVIDDILRQGFSQTDGYQVRLVIFGGLPRGVPSTPCQLISLGHVLKFLQEYVRKNWAMLRHIQFKDPAFGFLMTLEKARRGERRTRSSQVAPLQERRGGLEPVDVWEDITRAVVAAELEKPDRPLQPHPVAARPRRPRQRPPASGHHHKPRRRS